MSAVFAAEFNPPNGTHSGTIVFIVGPTTFTFTAPQEITRPGWEQIIAFGTDYFYDIGVESVICTITFSATTRVLTLETGGIVSLSATRVEIPAGFSIPAAKLDAIDWSV